MGCCKELLVEIRGLSALMQIVVRRCIEEESRWRGLLHCSTQRERLQGSCGIINLFRGEGEVGRRVGKGCGTWESRAVHDGLLTGEDLHLPAEAGKALKR